MALGKMHLAQVLALVVGVLYIVIGAVGFLVTGFKPPFAQNGPEALIGFDINGFHNLVHLVIGVVLVLAALSPASVTQGILIGGGAVYVLAAILGFANLLPVLSIDDSLAPDNFLHLVSGTVALAVGLFIGAKGPAPDIGGEPEITPRPGPH